MICYLREETKVKKLVVGICTIVLTILMFFPQTTMANSTITPSYEIKFYLDETTFADEDVLKNTFNVEKKAKKLKVYFLDTENKDLYKSGYIHRLRVYKNEDNVDLTYKKRFSNMDTTSAIDEAIEKGFHDGMSNYKFEIDWGFNGQKFSISRTEEQKTTSKVNDDDVKASKVKELFMEKAPEKIRNWNERDWYEEMIMNSKLTTPAYVKKYKGTFLDEGVTIEKWEHHGEVLIELSAKKGDVTSAANAYEEWKEELTANGLLSERGMVSKTSFVLQAP